MATEVPPFQTFMLPLLEVLARQPDPVRARDAYEMVANQVGLTEAQRADVLPSGRQRTYRNRIGWASTYLRFGGLVSSPVRGSWVITDEGRAVLASRREGIDLDFLETLPAYQQNRKRSEIGLPDDDLETESAAVDPLLRVRLKVERAVPHPDERRAALELLAFVIENADEERPDGWSVHENERGLIVQAGRCNACRLQPGRIELSITGPLPEAIRTELSADPARDYEWKIIAEGVTITFPPSRASRALELLRDRVDSFIDKAMEKLRRALNQEEHAADAVRYISSVVGRDLPQPEVNEDAEASSEPDDVDAQPAARTPIQRGRAPIFETGSRSVATLVDEIDREVLALPDLQRPFVWEDTKVRDLLDSLFLGFPVGTLVLWRTAEERDARAFGADSRGLRATALVIDGQQRLTSLYAILKGKPIVDKDGSRRNITIAFRPRDGRFEVADAAIRQDPEFLPNVTELWSGPRTKSTIKRELLKGLKEYTDEYADAVDQNLDRAQLIADFRFPTVEIRPSGDANQVNEEDVAEIFVRINNQGKRLGQADFVLTLLSVFHGDLRDRIEVGARELSEDSVVTLDVQQLLRASCAVGFARARMSAIYGYLRGIDPNSNEVSPAHRRERLAILDQAADKCLQRVTWGDFMLRVQHAGFVDASLVSSANAIVNAYAIYVQGGDLRVEKHRLDEAISRWVFATLLTARYSSSSETAFEQDLARLRDAKSPDEFIKTMDALLAPVIAGDYWERTLIADLETQRTRAPAALAFKAAQVVLGARALFSDQPLANLLRAATRPGRAASEAHHLYPKAYLERQGIKDKRRTNQIANLADIGWYDNAIIGSHGPAKYVPQLRKQREWTDAQWGRSCVEHALPPGWETLGYEDFLRERRIRMAHVIRSAYRSLGGEADAAPITPPWFLPGAEEVWSKVAATERALRLFVRETYSTAFGANAAARIEATLGASERESLSRALRSRPQTADPLSVVDYLYLGQLPKLLFAGEAWNTARTRLSGSDAKQRLQAAIEQVTPVRNEIAHVREVAPVRLQKASVACADILGMLAPSTTGEPNA